MLTLQVVTNYSLDEAVLMGTSEISAQLRFVIRFLINVNHGHNCCILRDKGIRFQTRHAHSQYWSSAQGLLGAQLRAFSELWTLH